ncbi:type II toxin-antitoxin system PemK/MazF family toxin [Candidatus Falkowbacteria bacterium]|nr:MAG: type II toxin-antitoxin system PemK/MazF family toxin [Candidatus Falkowbacteria bacterium]
MEEYWATLFNWTKLKLKIHNKPDDNTVFFQEREIWWVSLGINIGSEQNGKHGNFERPVLVLKKFNKSTLWIVPLTNQYKDREYYLSLINRDIVYYFNLSQLRLISSKRLLRKISKLSELEFNKVKESIKNLL